MPIAAQTKHTRAAIFLTENSIEIERKPDGFIVRFGKEPTPGMLGPPLNVWANTYALALCLKASRSSKDTCTKKGSSALKRRSPRLNAITKRLVSRSQSSSKGHSYLVLLKAV